jgi:hypothetical protein
MFVRWIYRAAAVFVCFALVFFPGVPALGHDDGNGDGNGKPTQGCTPGYWKNHTGSWAGFTTGQSLESVFDVPDALGLDNVSLLNALSFGGGSGLTGAAQMLLRAGVAAVLNAAHPDVEFLSLADTIDAVNHALASGSRSEMLAVAAQLDTLNNLGCPLN